MAVDINLVSQDFVTFWIDAIGDKTAPKSYADNMALLFRMFRTGMVEVVSDTHYRQTIISNKMPKAKFTDEDGTGMVSSDNVNSVMAPTWKSPYPIPYSYKISRRDNDALSSSNPLVRTKIIEANVKQIIVSIIETVSEAMFGDGSGDGGLAFPGIPAALSKTPSVGVYAGIDRAGQPLWRNKYYSLTTVVSGDPVFDGTATSASNILKRMSRIISRMSQGRGKPAMMILSDDYYQMYEDAVGEKQNIIISAAASDSMLDVSSMTFKGVEIVNGNGGLNFSTPKPGFGGMQAQTMYVIGSDAMKMFFINRIADSQSQYKQVIEKIVQKPISDDQLNTLGNFPVYPVIYDGGSIIRPGATALSASIQLTCEPNLLIFHPAYCAVASEL